VNTGFPDGDGAAPPLLRVGVGPTIDTVVGGGGVVPDQKTLSRLPAPHVSLLLPVHAILHDEAVVLMFVPPILLPQSVGW
jgi:hypothetical protein